MNKTYTSKFYEEMNEWSLRSAKEIVPIVLDLINIKSVVDIGCGNGSWLSSFNEYGVKDFLGIDGEWAKETLIIPKENFLVHNLEEPLKIKRTFDLAVCLEVVEHLEEKYSEIIVDSLTRLAPIVLFSAAIPFQKGTNHINLKWQEYWASLFQERGYVVIDYLREKVWNNEKVDLDYVQNTLIYVDKNFLDKNEALKKEYEKTEGKIISMVHPKKYLDISERYNDIVRLIPSPIKWIRNKLR